MYEVNRSVFLLIPLEPFWNWLQSLPGNHLDGLTLEDIQADANSYLVRPCETAELMRQQFEQADNPAPPTAKQKEFRLKYVDKVADPMFQACYKMAWQNYIAQQQLREARYYYDDWDFYHPFYRPPFWW